MSDSYLKRRLQGETPEDIEGDSKKQRYADSISSVITEASESDAHLAEGLAELASLSGREFDLELFRLGIETFTRRLGEGMILPAESHKLIEHLTGLDSVIAMETLSRWLSNQEGFEHDMLETAGLNDSLLKSRKHIQERRLADQLTDNIRKAGSELATIVTSEAEEAGVEFGSYEEVLKFIKDKQLVNAQFLSDKGLGEVASGHIAGQDWNELYGRLLEEAFSSLRTRGLLS